MKGNHPGSRFNKNSIRNIVSWVPTWKVGNTKRMVITAWLNTQEKNSQKPREEALCNQFFDALLFWAGSVQSDLAIRLFCMSKVEVLETAFILHLRGNSQTKATKELGTECWFHIPWFEISKGGLLISLQLLFFIASARIKGSCFVVEIGVSHGDPPKFPRDTSSLVGT